MIFKVLKTYNCTEFSSVPIRSGALTFSVVKASKHSCYQLFLFLCTYVLYQEMKSNSLLLESLMTCLTNRNAAQMMFWDFKGVLRGYAGSPWVSWKFTVEKVSHQIWRLTTLRLPCNEKTHATHMERLYSPLRDVWPASNCSSALEYVSEEVTLDFQHSWVFRLLQPQHIAFDYKCMKESKWELPR